jgi:hypothetical protein
MDREGNEARQKAEEEEARRKAEEEEARRKAEEDEARRKAATKTITNFLKKTVEDIKSRRRAEEAQRRAEEDKKTAAIVAAIEKRKQETAEQLDAARKKAEDRRRREKEEEERRRREQYEEERNKIAAIVAVDEKRKQEAEAEAERRRQKLRDIAASIITKNIKKFLEEKKEKARQREETRKREEEEERKKAAAAAAAIELERLRLEQERLERERLERERLERERLERLERERLERERLERERLERLEKERLERLERERLEKERLEAERRRSEEERKILAAILAAISQTQTVVKNPQTIFDFIDVFFVGNTEIIKKAVDDIRDILKYHFIYKQLNSYYITLISDNNKTEIASNMLNIKKIRNRTENNTNVKINDVNASFDGADAQYNLLLKEKNNIKIISQQGEYFKKLINYQTQIISFITKYVEITNFFDNNTISLVNINNVDNILSNIKDKSGELYPLLKNLLVLEREIKKDIEDTDTNTKNVSETQTLKDSIDALGKRLTTKNANNNNTYKGDYLNRRVNILRNIYNLVSGKNNDFVKNVGNDPKNPGWIINGPGDKKQIKSFIPYISHGWFAAFFELMTGEIDKNINSLLNTFDKYEKDNLNKNNIKPIKTDGKIDEKIKKSIETLNKIDKTNESGITEYIAVINETKHHIFEKIKSGCEIYILEPEESNKIIQDIQETTKSVKEFAVGKTELGKGYNDNTQTPSHVFSHFEKQPTQNTNLNAELKTQGFIISTTNTNKYPEKMGQYLEHVYQQYDNTNTVTDTHYLYLIPEIREQLLKTNKTNKIQFMSQVSSRFREKNQALNTNSDNIIIGNDDYDDQIGIYTNDVLFDLKSICEYIEESKSNPKKADDIKTPIFSTGRRP